jgi:hypothetical protein
MKELIDIIPEFFKDNKNKLIDHLKNKQHAELTIETKGKDKTASVKLVTKKGGSNNLFLLSLKNSGIISINSFISDVFAMLTSSSYFVSLSYNVFVSLYFGSFMKSLYNLCAFILFYTCNKLKIANILIS